MASFELLEELLVFFLAAFGDETQRIHFRRRILRNESRKFSD